MGPGSGWVILPKCSPAVCLHGRVMIRKSIVLCSGPWASHWHPGQIPGMATHQKMHKTQWPESGWQTNSDGRKRQSSSSSRAPSRSSCCSNIPDIEKTPLVRDAPMVEATEVDNSYSSQWCIPNPDNQRPRPSSSRTSHAVEAPSQHWPVGRACCSPASLACPSASSCLARSGEQPAHPLMMMHVLRRFDTSTCYPRSSGSSPCPVGIFLVPRGKVPVASLPSSGGSSGFPTVMAISRCLRHSGCSPASASSPDIASWPPKNVLADAPATPTLGTGRQAMLAWSPDAARSSLAALVAPEGCRQRRHGDGGSRHMAASMGTDAGRFLPGRSMLAGCWHAVCTFVHLLLENVPALRSRCRASSARHVWASGINRRCHHTPAGSGQTGLGKVVWKPLQEGRASGGVSASKSECPPPPSC